MKSNLNDLKLNETRKTPAGRGATFRVQGLVFFLPTFSDSFLFAGALNLLFRASIAARFLVTFHPKIVPCREVPLEASFSLLVFPLFFCFV